MSQIKSVEEFILKIHEFVRLRDEDKEEESLVILNELDKFKEKHGWD